jgi:RecG-like helicase
MAAAVSSLETPLQFVRGVGPRRAADLARVGLHTVEDFLLRFPLRYEDRANLKPIGALKPGQAATVVGEVLSAGVRATRRPGFRLFEVILKDATGHMRAVFPNQAFLREVFHAGQQAVLFGTLEYRGSSLQFTNPEYELIRGEGADEDDVTVHTGRIVPIYEKAGSVTTRMQRDDRAPADRGLAAELPDPVAAAHPQDAPAAGSARGDRRIALSVPRHADCSAQRAPHAGAAAADLRGVLSLPGRPDREEAPARPRSSSRAPSPSTTGFATRSGACCRSSSPRASGRR